MSWIPASSLSSSFDFAQDNTLSLFLFCHSAASALGNSFHRICYLFERDQCNLLFSLISSLMTPRHLRCTTLKRRQQPEV